jgi:hypothetical protein
MPSEDFQYINVPITARRIQNDNTYIRSIAKLNSSTEQLEVNQTIQGPGLQKQTSLKDNQANLLLQMQYREVREY